MEVFQAKETKDVKKSKRADKKNEEKTKIKDLRRREKRQTPIRERRLKNTSKNIEQRKRSNVVDELNDQMNYEPKHKRSTLTEEQRVVKNAYQRRWRASLADDQPKKSKNIKDPLKRALAEGKDIFVNRQGERFKICDCQKAAFFANKFEKRSSAKSRSVVKRTASVNIIVKPDIILNDCAQLDDVEMDRKSLNGFDNIVVKIEKEDEIHERIDEDTFTDCQTIKLELVKSEPNT